MFQQFKNMPRRAYLSRPAVLITLGVLLFLASSILSERFLRGSRLDLTAEGLYTLSDGSISLLQNLDEPIKLRYYFSADLAKDYPSLLAYGKRVGDLLSALESAASGRVELSIINPEPFSETEDDAVAAGLSGVPLGDGSTFYMGLSIEDQLDGSVALPFFAQERDAFLEYDIVKAIATLQTDGQPSLAILSQLPLQFGPGGPQAMFQGQSAPYAIYNQLEEFFSTEILQPDFTTIADYDLIMLIHPPELNDDQLYALEQYALQGGRLMVFVDPHAESFAQLQNQIQNQMRGPQAAMNLGPNTSTFALLKDWGVEVGSDKVVADRQLAQRVQLQGTFGPEVKSYPIWLALGAEQISSDDIATAPVKSLNMASAGALVPLDGANTTLVPLVQTSAIANLLDASRATGTPDPDSLNRELEDGSTPITLVGRVSGPVKSRFAQRATAEGGVSEGTINIVVGSDVDLFEDRFWVQVSNLLGQRIQQPIAGNGSLIINLADHLTGNDALLALRARGTAKRPFEVVADIRRRAEAQYAAEEQRLSQELELAEAKLAQLQSGEGGEQLITSEMEVEIERFKTQMLQTRRALRDVQGGLRRDIEALETKLIFINTALVPLLLLLAALGYSLWRRRQQAHLSSRV